MPIRRIVEYLDRHQIDYEVVDHEEAYTAQEAAAAAHIPGRELAKSVVVKVDGSMALAVLPAPYRVDLEALAGELDAERVEMASEEEFAELFPESELGAMPALGNLYDLPVYADRRLEADEEIAFAAGSHSQLVRMRFDDYQRLVEPRLVSFGRPED